MHVVLGGGGMRNNWCFALDFWTWTTLCFWCFCLSEACINGCCQQVIGYIDGVNVTSLSLSQVQVQLLLKSHA
jgi:hypothetical protein